MRVIWLLAGRQVRRQLSRRAVLAAALVLLTLAVLSTVIGLRSQAVQAARYEQLLKQSVREQARAAPLMGWQVESALRVIRPLNVATALVRGVELSTPAYWDFGPGGLLPSTAATVQDADDISPMVDIEFVIRVLVGLYALSVSMSAMGMLRRGGEMFGLTSLPLAPSQLWAGQALGVLLVVVVTWGVMVIAITIAAFAVTDGDSAWIVAQSIGRVTIPTLAYAACMVGLGATVAALTLDPVARNATGLAAWLIVACLAPPTLVSIARTIRPVSSNVVMMTARDSALAVAMRAAELAIGDTIAQQPPAQRPMTNPFAAQAFPILESMWQTRVQDARQKASAIEGAWDREVAAHDTWLQRAEWFSPASLFWRGATDAARSGRADRQAWDRAVRSHWDRLRQVLFDDRPRGTVSVPADQARQVMAMHRHAPVALRNMPPFQPGHVAQARTSDMAVTMLALSAYAAGLFALSLRMFLRGRR